MIDFIFRLLGSRAFWIGCAAALILILLYLFGYRWRPAIQVQFKQRDLIEAIEDRDSEELAELISSSYADDWGFKKSNIGKGFEDLRRHFLTLDIEASDLKVSVSKDGEEARISAVLRLRGRGNPVGEFIIERANRIEEPFIFEWRKEGGKPWDWKLVRVSNEGLPDLEGYSPGQGGGMLDDF